MRKITEEKKRCTAIVLAGGQGTRMGTKIQKQYLLIEGRPVLFYSLYVFEKSDIIDDVILVTGAGQTDYVRREFVEKYSFSLHGTQMADEGACGYRGVIGRGIDAPIL